MSVGSSESTPTFRKDSACSSLGTSRAASATSYVSGLTSGFESAGNVTDRKQVAEAANAEGVYLLCNFMLEYSII